MYADCLLIEIKPASLACFVVSVTVMVPGSPTECGILF